MIYDKVENIQTYIRLSDNLKVGLLFLQQVSPDIELGEYELTPNVKAIVSQYSSLKENQNGYEAHRKYIDIQYALKGSEVVRYLPLSQLAEKIPYSEEKDIAFYKPIDLDDMVSGVDLVIGDGFFTVLFPQDGHMPQISIGESQNIKKIVIKVKVE